ncbi:MAG: hypothetical protein OXK17_00315 [Thaumarchaeota archaeon]|nr:hypothetical protein [Nitrososphaerota archaeon]
MTVCGAVTSDRKWFFRMCDTGFSAETFIRYVADTRGSSGR